MGDPLEPGGSGAAVTLEPGWGPIVQGGQEIRPPPQRREGVDEPAGRLLQRDHIAREVDNPLDIHTGRLVVGMGDIGAAADLTGDQAAPFGFDIGLGHRPDAQAQAMGQDALRRQAGPAANHAASQIGLQGAKQPLVERPGLVIQRRQPVGIHARPRYSADHIAIGRIVS